MEWEKSNSFKEILQESDHCGSHEGGQQTLEIDLLLWSSKEEQTMSLMETLKALRHT